MTKLFITIIILVMIITSMGIGRRMGMKHVPAYIEGAWARHKRSYPALANAEEKDPSAYDYRDKQRSEAIAMVWAYTFLWFLFVPMDAIAKHERKAIEKVDPYLAKQKAIECQKRIVELERENDVLRVQQELSQYVR